MTIRGDMEAYCFIKLGINVEKARKVIACALEAADDPNFADAYQRKTEVASGFNDYMDVINFLKELVR